MGCLSGCPLVVLVVEVVQEPVRKGTCACEGEARRDGCGDLQEDWDCSRTAMYALLCNLQVTLRTWP